MTEYNYAAIIPYKVKEIISLIIENKNKDFLDAIKYLYSSKLYEYLSREETKYWHFSSAKLYDMLENEKQNNKLEQPDFV